MLNNLTNFFSILAGKRYKSTPEDNDLVALGTKDEKYRGNYKPTATRLVDLKAYFGGGGGAWDLLRTAVIDSETGDDATGTVGDGNLPFRTVAAAKTAGATNFYLLPGEYTETITLASEETYYAAQGVVFTAGGLRSPATNLDNCKWLGSANFIGNFEALYLIEENVITDFVFEFDTIRTTNTAGREMYIWVDRTTESTVTITGNEVYSYGGNANCIGTLGRVSGTINIKRKLSGFYSLWSSFGAGTLTLNCPNMVLLDGGWAGNVGSYKQLFVSYASSGYENITINGNFYSEVASSLTSIAGVIMNHTGSAPKKITFNGSAKADQLLYGVSAGVAGGTITINGDMYLPQGRLLSQTGAGSQVAFEDGNSTVSLSSSLGIGVSCFVKNYDILMTADAHIFRLTDVTSQLVTNNVNAEGIGVSPSSYFISTSGAPFQAGLKDTWSTQINDPGFVNAYASGFTNEPLLKVNPIV